MPVTIYGASDDLIEVEGAIRAEFGYQERGYGQQAGDLLAFSDGTVLRVEYTAAGIWRITPVVRGTSELTIEQAPGGGEENSSDRATLTGDVAWVVQGIALARAAIDLHRRAIGGVDRVEGVLGGEGA